MNQKVIYDFIHGNIELSNVESFLLKNPLVNRLHQILQNSTAYNVFPNMKSSRFEHSLGAMNYSGLIYNYGLINSNCSDEYFAWLSIKFHEILKKHTVNFTKYNTYINEANQIKIKTSLIRRHSLDRNENRISLFELFEKDSFNKKIETFIGGDFLKRNLFFGYEKNHKINILLYQTTRLFGLLHDIGHLPLSHLFEFSLIKVYEHLSEKYQKYNEGIGDIINESEHNYLKKLTQITDTAGEYSNDQIHEKIGKNITKYIFEDVKRKIIEESNNICEDFDNIIIIEIIEVLFNEITKKHNSILKPFHTIISGTIDSDRLDFIQRDGILSGMVKSAGNIDRIIKMFCLSKIKDEKNEDEYLFMPSVQSLNDVEEVLHNRLKSYKYVVNHHAVGRSDYIYQKLIEKKILKELSNIETKNETSEIDKNSLLLCSVIDRVVEILDENNAYNLLEVQLNFTQITDFWLLNILLNEFRKSIIDENEFNDDKYFPILLSEVFENKKKVKSLWKRKYNYEVFLFKLAKQFVTQTGNAEDSELLFNWFNNDYQHNLENEHSNKDSLETFIRNKYLDILRNKKSIISYYTFFDFFLYSECFKNIDLIDNNLDNYELIKKISSDDIIYNLFVQLGKNLIVKEVLGESKGLTKTIEQVFNSKGELILIKPAKISDGIKNAFIVDKRHQENIFDFNKISSKKKIFAEEIYEKIDFFVFYFESGKGINHVSFKENITANLIDEILINLKNK